MRKIDNIEMMANTMMMAQLAPSCVAHWTHSIPGAGVFQPSTHSIHMGPVLLDTHWLPSKHHLG